jgi:hypothetical protein
LEYLAESEHMRWVAFHVMNGYRYDEKGKEKDRENIRAALR